MSRRIGLDVGGVIIDAVANDGTDTDIRGDNFMSASPVPGVFEAVRRIVMHCGADGAFIISKCGEFIEDRTRRWLAGNDFYAYTGFNPRNVHFCRYRADKAPIAQELGLTDFVDDHPEVLKYMEGIVVRRHLFGPQVEVIQPANGLILMRDWSPRETSALLEM